MPCSQRLKASKEDVIESCISHAYSSVLVDLNSTAKCASGMNLIPITERYNFDSHTFGRLHVFAWMYMHSDSGCCFEKSDS